MGLQSSTFARLAGDQRPSIGRILQLRSVSVPLLPSVECTPLTLRQRRVLVSYDTQAVAIQKAQYINQMGLGGTMWWELDADKPEDTGGALVRTVRDALGKLEWRENELSYPGSSESGDCISHELISEYDNVRNGM